MTCSNNTSVKDFKVNQRGSVLISFFQHYLWFELMNIAFLFIISSPPRLLLSLLSLHRRLPSSPPSPPFAVGCITALSNDRTAASLGWRSFTVAALRHCGLSPCREMACPNGSSPPPDGPPILPPTLSPPSNEERTRKTSEVQRKEIIQSQQDIVQNMSVEKAKERWSRVRKEVMKGAFGSSKDCKCSSSYPCSFGIIDCFLKERKTSLCSWVVEHLLPIKTSSHILVFDAYTSYVKNWKKMNIWHSYCTESCPIATNPYPL